MIDPALIDGDFIAEIRDCIQTIRSIGRPVFIADRLEDALSAHLIKAALAQPIENGSPMH